MRRAGTGRRIELSPRDLAIFVLLGQYRYLRSTFIHAFVGGASVTRFKERLGDLFHEGYLDRPEQQWALANCRHVPAVYEIGAGARRALVEQGDPGDDARTWLGNQAHRQFLHSLMICEVLASIELGVRANPALRLIPWPEILAKAPEATRRSSTPFRIPGPPNDRSDGGIVPDAIFGLEYRTSDTKCYRFFALEADRGTMPVIRSNSAQSSYEKKLLGYREILARQTYRSHLGLPNLLVLTVTPNEVHLERMMSSIRETTGGSAAFLFRTWGVAGAPVLAPSSDFLVTLWRRTDGSSLRIDQV